MQILSGWKQRATHRADEDPRPRLRLVLPQCGTSDPGIAVRMLARTSSRPGSLVRMAAVMVARLGGDVVPPTLENAGQPPRTPSTDGHRCFHIVTECEAVCLDDAGQNGEQNTRERVRRFLGRSGQSVLAGVTVQASCKDLVNYIWPSWGSNGDNEAVPPAPTDARHLPMKNAVSRLQPAGPARED